MKKIEEIVNKYKEAKDDFEAMAVMLQKQVQEINAEVSKMEVSEKAMLESLEKLSCNIVI